MRPGESFVSQPIRSLQTMLRVLSEDDRRLPTVVPDGIYGPTTMQAVSTFQRMAGIPVTGVADQVTWDRIVNAYEPAMIRVGKAEPLEIILDPNKVFRKGDIDPYIYLIQSILIQLSNDHSAITPPDHNGILDVQTEQAIIQFQTLAGLPANGEFDKITWKHLAKHYAAYVNHYNTRGNQNAQSSLYA